MTKILLVFFTYLCIGFFGATPTAEDFSQNLEVIIDRLFSKYNKNVRPAKKVEVKLMAAMGRLIDVNEDDGVFEAMIINGIAWHDHRLKWDPEADFGLGANNITEFAYPSDNLWIPDVRIYDALNGPDVGGFSGHEQGLTLISHDGKVKFVPQTLVKGAIDTEAGKKENEMKIEGENGKTIVLSLIYAPWVHSSSAVELKAGTTSVDIKSVNPKWKVTKSLLKEITETYPCCPMPYTAVKLIMHINRV